MISFVDRIDREDHLDDLRAFDNLDKEHGKIFVVPFITRKPKGLGLGLFIARRIAENHQVVGELSP